MPCCIHFRWIWALVFSDETLQNASHRPESSWSKQIQERCCWSWSATWSGSSAFHAASSLQIEYNRMTATRVFVAPPHGASRRCRRTGQKPGWANVLYQVKHKWVTKWNKEISRQKQFLNEILMKKIDVSRIQRLNFYMSLLSLATSKAKITTRRTCMGLSSRSSSVDLSRHFDGECASFRNLALFVSNNPSECLFAQHVPNRHHNQRSSKQLRWQLATPWWLPTAGSAWDQFSIIM